jgi:hypothetical protein
VLADTDLDAEAAGEAYDVWWNDPVNTPEIFEVEDE